MHGETEVLVGQNAADNQLFIRPLGPCNTKTAGAIQRQLPSLIKPETTVVVFLLAGVTTMDSTFIGLLLMLRRSSADDCPQVWLSGVTPTVRHALDVMHLLPLFEIRESAPPEPTDWVRLDGETLSAEQLAEIVLRAHESIVEADGRNAAEFGRVIEGFRDARSSNPSDAESARRFRFPKPQGGP